MKLAAMMAALSVALLAQRGFSQGLASIDEQIAADGIATQQIGDGLYVFYFESGGNLVVSIGTQGVLIIDDHFTDSVPVYQAKIRELGGGDIDFVVNTHWHYDHTEGNQILGPQGAWMVSQANSRDMMTRANIINVVVRPSVNQAPYETDALPFATFDDTMQLHFNGERLDLLHFGPAHTTGDAAVILRGHNVVHLGDVFNTSGFPFIDADNGGDIDGVIRFCEAVLLEIDQNTIVVPGHGRIATYADLQEYVAMLTVVRDRVAALIAQGATLEEVLEARTTAEWEADLGDPTRLIDRAYASLSR
jgi:glyoxylase-like metal-dependent hydrolase (beta-lactamase superfamily II)